MNYISWPGRQRGGDQTQIRYRTVRVELPQPVTWPTRTSVRHWEMRVAAEARYTIVSMDTNVATLILDGQAFRTKPWNALATLPALATVITVAPTNDFWEVLRGRRSVLAHRWLATTLPRSCLRPKISNTVREELKASKQVCLQKIKIINLEHDDHVASMQKHYDSWINS